MSAATKDKDFITRNIQTTQNAVSKGNRVHNFKTSHRCFFLPRMLPATIEM
jgi:hypothetical protein